MDKMRQLLSYIESQIIKVNAFDECKGKKGSQLQQAKSKKEGYLEALENVKAVIVNNIMR